jgi:hypothetical protein
MLKPQLCMGMVVGILAWLSAPAAKGADIDLHELKVFGSLTLLTR